MGFDDEHNWAKAPDEWIRTNPLFAERRRRPLKPKPFPFQMNKTFSEGALLAVNPEDLDVPLPAAGQPQPPLRFGAPSPLGRGRRRGQKLQSLSQSASQLGVRADQPNPTAGLRLEPLPLAQQHAAQAAGAQSGNSSPSNAERTSLKDGKGRRKKKAAQPTSAIEPTIETPIAVEELDDEAEQAELTSLQEIAAVATSINEVMQSLTTTTECMGQHAPPDFISDLGALNEISSLASKVVDMLEEPPAPPPPEDYDDDTLARARKLAQLTYELVEDMELASDGCGMAVQLQEEEDETAHLQNISEGAQHVAQMLVMLQGSSWAAGTLSRASDERSEDEDEGQVPEQDEAMMSVEDKVDDEAMFDERDPKIMKLLERTRAKVQGTSDGYDDDETEDLKAAFIRFKVPDSADIHKDDLDALLNFIGRWVPPDEVIREIAKEVTMYDYMDFDEFLTFMKAYDAAEQQEQMRVQLLNSKIDRMTKRAQDKVVAAKTKVEKVSEKVHKAALESVLLLYFAR